MNALLRPLIACLLALILMTGSVATAVARGEMAGVSAVTLCGSDGALTTLQIDASGKPVQPGHDCPHCLAAGALAIVDAAPPVPGHTALRGTRVLPGQTVSVPPLQALAPSARGPPPLV